MPEEQTNLNELSKRERKKLNKLTAASDTHKKYSKNKLLTVGAIIALATAFFLFINRSGSNSNSSTGASDVISTEISAEENSKGPEDAAVTLVEYADFQCPACASYFPLVEQLSKEYSDKMRIVSRHFPLRSIHKHAQISAQAAEAAAKQEKYWEMASLLYKKQDEWSNTRDPRGLFKQYAEELSLNLNQFEKDMNSSEAKAKVDADYESALSLGINSTPTFYLNGNKIDSPKNYEDFKQKIEEIIKEAAEESGSSKEGSPEAEVAPQL